MELDSELQLYPLNYKVECAVIACLDIKATVRRFLRD